MTKFFILSILTLLFGCSLRSKKEVRITLKNQTKYLIDSVIIRSHEVNEVFRQVQPGDSISKDVAFNFQVKYEGAWTILVYENSDLKRSGSFGYYSNSSDIKNSYTLTIYNNFSYKEN